MYIILKYRIVFHNIFTVVLCTTLKPVYHIARSRFYNHFYAAPTMYYIR